MDNGRWERIQKVFHCALELSPEERRSYLLTECGDDKSLLSDVEDMLDEDALGQSVLDQGLPGIAGDTSKDHAASLPIEDFGLYKIQRVLGEGGMGIVYLAERTDIGSVVAIKVLREATLSPARRARFVSEQRTLGQLNHPLIARIYDAGSLGDGTPWFVMEYVDGLPITEYCGIAGCSIRQKLALFRSACQAVQFAHAQAFIHRDLKPSNTLVKSDGTVKLLDFGIAKHLESSDEPEEQTKSGLRPMTLAYASPEQIRGERLGTQTDVYSLGVMLYELLTGQLPFDLSGCSQVQAEQIVLTKEPEPPSATARRASHALGADRRLRRAEKTTWAEIDVMVLTMMHKDLKRRYSSVEAVIRDLDHYFKCEPLEARPDTVSYRLGKFAKRHRRAISVTITASTIVVALVVFFVVRLARARTVTLAEISRAQRIERFMLSLFDGGDKMAGPANSLPAITLLDRGIQTASSLSAEPAVQADLYQTLGNMYQKLGKLDRAEPLLRSALDRRKSIAGADSLEAADGLIALGLLRLDQARVAEAERLVREGLAIDKRHLPPDHPVVAKAISALGRVLEDRGAYQEAIQTLEEAVRLQSRQSQTTTDLSESLSELATAHYYIGHLDIAESLNERALTIDHQLYGAIHPRVGDDLYNLGLIQHDLGHDADAERYYRQALAVKQSWYGTEHPDTALMMAAVGQSLVYQGRYDEAAPILRQALAIQERIFGMVHSQVAMGVNVIGLLELRRGHLSDAEKYFLRMADINRSIYGDRHYLVGIAELNLGEVYIEQKNIVQAERAYRNALVRFTEQLPPTHPSTGIAQVRLGHALLLERRPKQAEGYLLAGYELLIKQPGPQAARIQKARKDLVAVYESLGQPDKAAKFRTELVAGLGERKVNPPAH